MNGLWPTSPEFAAAITQSHTVDVLAEILVGGVPVEQVLFSSDGVSGSRSNFGRRSASPTLLDPALVPRGRPGDLISLGNEVRLWRGISAPLPAVERVPLLTGRIIGGRIGYENGRVAGVAVDLNDRCTTLAYERFPSPVVVRSTSAVSLIQRFVSDVFPEDVVDISAMGGYDIDIGGQVFDRDRDGAIKLLATALGAEFSCTPLGQFVLAPIPDPAGDVDLDIAGGDGGNLVTGERDFSDSNVYNGIVVTGQATTGGTPRSQLMVDSDPSSPTKWGGTFGRRVGFVDNSAVRTNPQADVAASGQLRNTVGLAKSVSLTVLPDPRIQEGAIIGVTFPAQGNDPAVYEQHVVDTVTIPDKATDPVTLSTRATQVVIAAAS